MRSDNTPAHAATDRSPQGTQPRYETAKGCLMLGGAALVTLTVIVVAIVLFANFST